MSHNCYRMPLDVTRELLIRTYACTPEATGESRHIQLPELSDRHNPTIPRERFKRYTKPLLSGKGGLPE